jgi:hypothetical protein
MTDKPMIRDELTATLKANPRFREVENLGRGFTGAAAQPPKSDPERPPSPEVQALLDEYERHKGRNLRRRNCGGSRAGASDRSDLRRSPRPRGP